MRVGVLSWTALTLLGLVCCTQLVPGPDSCPPGTRFCKSLRFAVPAIYYNRCLAEEFWCDGNNDCHDQLDEMNCFECGPRGLHCNINRCVRKEYQCDGHKDCMFNGDESYCISSGDKFRCPNGRTRLKSTLCDGWDDCGDGGDEENCTEVLCEDHAVWCDGTCRAASHRCDGYAFCYDGRDEMGCPVFLGAPGGISALGDLGDLGTPGGLGTPGAPGTRESSGEHGDVLLYLLATSSLLISLGTLATFAVLVRRHLRRTPDNTGKSGVDIYPHLPRVPEYSAVSNLAGDCGQGGPAGQASAPVFLNLN